MAHRWDPIAPPVRELFHPVPIDPTGQHGPTRGQSQGPGWRRTSPGLFVPGSVTDERVEQRIVETALSCVDRAVITGWASLRLQGGGYFDGLARDGRTRLPVPILAGGERMRPGPGVWLVRAVVPVDEVVIVHGVRCATIERALFDEIRRLHDPREWVVAADMAFAAQLTSLRRMRRYRFGRYWYRDVRRLDETLALADEHARSGPEVRFRLIWQLDAGWTRPLTNRAVLDLDGRLIGVPDLIDPVRGVVGEYAGADHRDIDRHGDDIAREATFRRVGLEYVEVVGRDIRAPDRIVTRMLEAEKRSGLLPQLWQLGAPPPSLDEILDRVRPVE